MEKEHHVFGGSTARYWSVCAGWASLVSTITPEKSGPAAERGNILHKGVLEVKTQQEIDHRIKGTDIVLDYSGIEGWPEEGPELAEEFWNYLWKEILEEFVTGKTIYIERKLMLFPELDSGGTADFIALWYNDKGKLVAALGDCKFGRVRVEPSEEQLKFYLTALNKIVREKGKVIDEFIAFVYQPEHYNKFTTHRFTKSEIEKAEVRYEKAIIESKRDKPKFKAGDWCEYCKARGKCQTYTTYVDKKMEMMVIRNKDVVQFAAVEELSDDIVAKVIQFGDKITKQIEAIKKEGYIRMISGKKIEGLKLVAGTPRRSIQDHPANVEFFKGKGIVPTEESLVSIGELTKRLQATGLKKKEADEIINQVAEKSDPPPKVTTSDDPKPEIVIRNPSDLLIGLGDEDSEF